MDNNIEKITHTHLLTTDRGIVRGKETVVEATYLIDWISTNVPTVANMAEPLTEQNVVWMLRKYSIEDIKRIILAMHNKQAYKNTNAYTTFSNFARYDKELNDRRNDKSSDIKLYTYDEVCDLVSTHRYKMDDFERKIVGGRSYWIKKIEVVQGGITKTK